MDRQNSCLSYNWKNDVNLRSCPNQLPRSSSSCRFLRSLGGTASSPRLLTRTHEKPNHVTAQLIYKTASALQVRHDTVPGCPLSPMSLGAPTYSNLQTCCNVPASFPRNTITYYHISSTSALARARWGGKRPSVLSLLASK